MKDLIPEWIQNYKDFQQMPLKLICEVEDLLERNSDNEDALDIKKFLEDRYDTLQDEIEKWEAAAASGSKVLLMNDDEQAGWDARTEALKLAGTVI